MNKIAVFDLKVAVDSRLENVFVDFLKNLKMSQHVEPDFLRKHGIAIRDFVYLQTVFNSMVKEIETAKDPATVAAELPTHEEN